jgi:hypothetical protein
MPAVTGHASKAETEADAAISACGRWRYSLSRRWQRGPLLLFVLLNPSTADAERDDPTVARCVRRACDLGFGGIELVNLFALRATDPRALALAPDPVGPGNDDAIGVALGRADMCIAAWGQKGRLGSRDAAVRAQLALSGVPVRVLGLCRDGAPRHPLYVALSVAPQPWQPGSTVS